MLELLGSFEAALVGQSEGDAVLKTSMPYADAGRTGLLPVKSSLYRRPSENHADLGGLLRGSTSQLDEGGQKLAGKSGHG